ncbi:MAG: hypothetical protein HQ521_09435 [Bacteroidetes bacterium]|nr:hypothetical protein [Bacteroidota bacterium]
MKNLQLMLSIFLIFLLSCTTANKQWEKAKEANSIEGYELFLSKYPESEHSQEALNIKGKLEENNLWEETKDKNTVEGYELFLSKYTDSEFSEEAKNTKANLEEIKIKLREQRLWEEAKSKNTIEGYELFLSKYPDGEYSQEAKNTKANLEEIKIKLREQRLWGEAKSKNTIKGYELFLSNYPRSKYLQEALNAKAKLMPNIVFKQINKSKYKTSYGIYREPTTVVASDGTLLGEFICHQSTWITGLNVYFYIMNKGGSGKVSIKFTYSDDLGTKVEEIKGINLLKSKEYKVKVSLKFKSNVAVSTPNHNRLNNLEIILPNNTKDKFSASITSWQGSITNIEFIEVK